MATVIGLFKQYENAERAVDDLLAHRFTMDEISSVVPDSARKEAERDAATGRQRAAGSPGILGLGGVLSGIKGTLEPDLGTSRTEGPLAAAGERESAPRDQAGRLGVALVAAGVPAGDADACVAAVRQGFILLAVDAGDRESEARSILAVHNAASPAETRFSKDA